MGQGRHNLQELGRRALPCPVDIREEEGFIFPVVDLGNVGWAADGKAEIVILEQRNRRLEVLPRLQVAVLEKFVGRPVNFVGAALADHVELAAAAGAELRTVVLPDGIHFRDNLHIRGQEDVPVPAGIDVIARRPASRHCE